MILMVAFDCWCDVLQVPDRLNYNVPALGDEFYSWVEDNPKCIRYLKDGDIGLSYNGDDFVEWLKECVLSKSEYVKILEKNLPLENKNKYPKKNRYILYF